MHCIEGITTASKNASAKAPPPHSLPPKPVLAALSAEGGSKQAGGSRSPTTVSGSKIPLHPHSQQQLQQQHHRQQQQQRCASSGGGASGSPSGSTGEIGPSFNRSPNPVFQAQPQHSSSTSSRASNVSGVVRGLVYLLKGCYSFPLHYTSTQADPSVHSGGVHEQNAVTVHELYVMKCSPHTELCSRAGTTLHQRSGRRISFLFQGPRA
eukprot:1153558-Pelagomonas_calceolata.AAC.7